MRRRTDFYAADEMSRQKVIDHFEANRKIYRDDKEKAEKIKIKKEAE